MSGDGTEPVTYCRRWNTITATPIEPLTPARAQRRDRAKQWYAAVVGDVAAPRCFVEVAWENEHVGVWFLDDHLRQSAHYSFTRVDEKTLFLDTITVWHYPRGASRDFDDATTIESIEYTPEGLATRETTDVKTDTLTTEQYSDVPLDLHWEPVPTFGDYRSLTRLDRSGTP